MKKTYLMRNNESGSYKIGRSKNVNARFSQLKCAVPLLELVAVCNDDIELELHKRYKNLGIGGEWFSLNDSDISEIINLFNNKSDLLNGIKPIKKKREVVNNPIISPEIKEEDQMILKTTPFNKNGSFKKGHGFSIVNREVCKPQSSSDGIKLLPIFKADGKPWTAFDCPSIVKRLILLGETIHTLSSKTGYSKSYLEAIERNSLKLSDKALYKLMEIENEIKGG
jgi:hypothetical protein